MKLTFVDAGVLIAAARGGNIQAPCDGDLRRPCAIIVAVR